MRETANLAPAENGFMQLPKTINTKITPPPRSARTLERPRVTGALAEGLNYRLTLLSAGAGYGKSTALTVLAEQFQPVIWYQVAEEDNDPLVFLLHLSHATQRALSGVRELPTPFLESWEGNRGPLPATGVVDQYINALSEELVRPCLLILDDISYADSNEIAHLLDRLISLAPPHLHILLSARIPIQLPNMARWRSQGQVLNIDHIVLAFQPEEISELFSQHYRFELTDREAKDIAALTEGWAIAIQLIWQSLRSGTASSVQDALTRQGESQENLFAILAREVFDGQPEDVKDFLLVSSTLREMTPEACDALLNGKDGFEFIQDGVSSAGMLAYLKRQELFVVDQGERGAPQSLRYHHIFHQFLRSQADPGRQQTWHKRAADYFHERQNPDEAVYHLLQAKDPQRAADLLDSYGAQLIMTGRLDTLAMYLDTIPPDTLRLHPALLFHMGDLLRLYSRFDEALGWYQQAEKVWRAQGQIEGIGRALRGQARVYLDTINPSKAEELLQQALHMSDGTEDRESQSRLYELLGENKLNAGHIKEAERLRQKAEALQSEGPSDSQLLFRVLLRTGRLAEAQQRLETRVESERRSPVQTPRAHRETLLVLSLVYAFQGLAAESYQAALEGTQRGIELHSPFVTAVGHMRQGHALMLPPEDLQAKFSQGISSERYNLAREQFEKTVEISRQLAVSRLLVEAYWGLCRVYGYQGDLVRAMQFAKDGIEIANQAGDEWIACLVRLVMGASFALANRFDEAFDWLGRAAIGFQECSDPFGMSAARLWKCLILFWDKRYDRLSREFPELLSTCRSNGYDFLFTRSTLLGPPDNRALIPLLIHGVDKGWQPEYAEVLLEKIGLPGIHLHPGYQLKVTTLGTFQVWRGTQLIPPGGWRREKARQLLQLLLAFRDAPLDREQIIEYLWPESDPESAQRNFKVTLNTLYNVLEPDRPAGSESAYILREGSTYTIRPASDLLLDADAFLAGINQAGDLLSSSPEAASRELEQALSLYQGEFLPDARYETWAAGEREHLAVIFLRACDQLSDLHIQTGNYEKAIDLCQRILSYDNCWERAYRHIMLAYDLLGDHGQVARTYQRCVQTLQRELNVQPAPETLDLYNQLTQSVL